MQLVAHQRGPPANRSGQQQQARQQARGHADVGQFAAHGKAEVGDGLPVHRAPPATGPKSSANPGPGEWNGTGPVGKALTDCCTSGSGLARTCSGLPWAATTPAPKMITWSASRKVSSRSCETTMLVRPIASLSWRISGAAVPSAIGSSPANGSSYMTSSGSSTIARANATRRAMPPDIWAGIRSRAARRPTACSFISTTSRISASDRSVCSRSAKATFSKTLRSVNSAPNWNNMPMRRRAAYRPRASMRPMSWPSNKTWPLSAFCNPPSSRSTVVLPPPEAPISAVTLPRGSASVMSRKITRSAEENVTWRSSASNGGNGTGARAMRRKRGSGHRAAGQVAAGEPPRPDSPAWGRPAGNRRWYPQIPPPSRSAGQFGIPHQKPIDRMGRLPALADGPDDQRLAPAHVAGGKDLGHVGGVAAVGFGAGAGIATGILLHPKGVEHRRHRADEAHGQQHQVGREGLFRAVYFDQFAVLELHAHGFQARHTAFVADEFPGGDGELARAALFVAGTGAQLDRPVGPGPRACFFFWRPGQALAPRAAGHATSAAGAHAVAAGVAAADHDPMLAVRAQLRLELVAGIDLVLLGQEFHREVDAVQPAAGHRQVA